MSTQREPDQPHCEICHLKETIPNTVPRVFRNHDSRLRIIHCFRYDEALAISIWPILMETFVPKNLAEIICCYAVNHMKPQNVLCSLRLVQSDNQFGLGFVANAYIMVRRSLKWSAGTELADEKCLASIFRDMHQMYVAVSL